MCSLIVILLFPLNQSIKYSLFIRVTLGRLEARRELFEQLLDAPLLLLQLLQIHVRHRPLEEVLDVLPQPIDLGQTQIVADLLLGHFQRAGENVVDQALVEAQLLQTVQRRDLLQQHGDQQPHLRQNRRLVRVISVIREREFPLQFVVVHGFRASNLMLLQLVLRLQKQRTELAAVRFVHAVNGPHVRLQMRQLREGGVHVLAHHAFERLLAGVLADVQLEDA